MAIEHRIKEERTRLGHSQASFAALCGKSLRSQTGWEQGRSLPDAGVLALWADAGVDITYVLTGRTAEPVSDDEADLLRRYRASPPALREAGIRVLGGSPAPAAAGPTVHGEIGQVVQGDLHTPSQTFHVGGGAAKRGTRK